MKNQEKKKRDIHKIRKEKETKISGCSWVNKLRKEWDKQWSRMRVWQQIKTKTKKHKKKIPIRSVGALITKISLSTNTRVSSPTPMLQRVLNPLPPSTDEPYQSNPHMCITVYACVHIYIYVCMYIFSTFGLSIFRLFSLVSSSMFSFVFVSYMAPSFTCKCYLPCL